MLYHLTTRSAFSVFLFDDAGRLLLQQRASSKITFPSVSTLFTAAMGEYCSNGGQMEPVAGAHSSN